MPIIDVDALGARELIAEYEHFVECSPYGNMMQSTKWSGVKNNWNADYVYLADSKDGGITAALSILSVSNDGGESSFMYAPRGPVCDFSDLDTVARLIDEARPVVEKRKGFVLRLDPEFPYSSELAHKIHAAHFNDGKFLLRTIDETDPHAFSQPPFNMVLDLKGKDVDTLLDFYPSNTRRKIRKPFKSGVTTRSLGFGDPGFSQALNEFYRLTGIMAERQGISYRPRSYFVRLFEVFPGARLYITKHESGAVLASCIVVNYNRKAFYMYAASSNEMRNLYPNYQMNFVAIQDAIRSSMNEYDMGGIFVADDADGLYRFKKQLCGAEGLRSYIGELDLVFDDAKYRAFIE